MNTIVVPPAEGNGEVHPDPEYWLWQAYYDPNVARLLETVHQRQVAGIVATFGKKAGFVVGSRVDWIAWTGLTPRKFDRGLHRAKMLPFFRGHRWWRREFRQAIWLRIEHGEVPDVR